MLLSESFGGVIPGARGAVLSTLLRTDARLTGRQVHALVSDRHSLWSVQEALKAWAQLGVVHTQTIGRAVVHAINEDHCAVAPLRSLLNPLAALTETAAQIAGDRVEAIILFGSVARGEAHEGSDIDLAVIAQSAGTAASTWKMPCGEGSAMTAMPLFSPSRISRTSRQPTSPSLTRYLPTAYPSPAQGPGVKSGTT